MSDRGISPPVGPRRNRLLLAFPDDVLTRLSNQLEPIELKRGMVILPMGVTTSHICFPDYGMISLVKAMQDGRTAEVGVVGPEGMIGVPAVLGLNPPSVEGIVQVDGSAHRIEVAVLRAETERSRPLKELVLRYMNFRISQLAQTAACNRLHRIRQRCCRWLLAVQDSVQTPHFTLTHEFLALMMGVNRPRLSITLEALQKAGMIKYHYTNVLIANRRALEENSCECYETLRDEADHACQP